MVNKEKEYIMKLLKQDIDNAKREYDVATERIRDTELNLKSYEQDLANAQIKLNNLNDILNTVQAQIHN